MHKLIYIRPELEVVKLTLQDVLGASAENLSTEWGGIGDWGDPELPDPDDEIVW